MSLATSESWKDRETGERREKTEWHRVVIFNEALANIAEQYLKKGAKIYLEGQLQSRKWTDDSGSERYTTEVVLQRYRGELTMLDSRNTSNSDALDNSGTFVEPESTNSIGPVDGGSSTDLDDDIPF